MRVLSAERMRWCDRETAEHHGVATLELMRAAAAAVAEVARQQWPVVRRVTALCGTGNNGGDGMMAARLLAEAGWEATVLLLGDPEKIAGDAAVAWRELHGQARARILVALTEEELAAQAEVFQTDLLVDALVGTGFRPPLRGLAWAARERVCAGNVPVLAVDLPSGWEADATAAEAEAFPADAVVTFTAAKPAHLFGHLTRRWNDPVLVVPIGSPECAVAEAEADSDLNVSWSGNALDLVQQPRAQAANKGRFGHVLVVGGCFGAAGGKAGAPAMTALAALRAGAGLVTAAVPAPAMPVVAAVAPELMCWPLQATTVGEIADATLPKGLIAGKTVLAAGPGMGQSAEAARFLRDLLANSTVPAVLDADALNLLAAHPEMLAAESRRRMLVLTPHPGEMARLTGLSVAEVQADRMGVARHFAVEHGVTLVLKGARTLIAHPDGRVAVNTSGNPAMAKGGSGDVLTGVIAGLLAQYPQDAARAVEAAVWLHGRAADLAAGACDEHTLLATDTLGEFSRAFRFPIAGENGYVWLQGMKAGERPIERL